MQERRDAERHRNHKISNEESSADVINRQGLSKEGKRGRRDNQNEIVEYVLRLRKELRELEKSKQTQANYMGIKKDTSLGGAGDDKINRKSYGASSDASDIIIPKNSEIVNENSNNFELKNS